MSPQGDGGVSSTNGSKRGFYIKTSGKEKGEYTYNHGMATTIRHFKKTGQFDNPVFEVPFPKGQ